MKIILSTNLSKIDNNINAIKLINKNSQDNRVDISTNSEQRSTNTGNISSNLSKLNNMDIDVKKDIYKEIFNIKILKLPLILN